MENNNTSIIVRKIIYALLIASFQLSVAQCYAQVGGVAINSTGGAADNSAMLDVSSTNQGMRIPRVALESTQSSAPITNQVNSLLVYDSATVGDVTPGFYYWDETASKWIKFSTGSGGGWSTSGNAGTDTATNFTGTTDDRSWVMKTNNTQRMKISKTGNVVIGATNPESSAILDVSSTTKGQLMPRMTTIQRDAIVSPATGLQIFNTDCNINEYYTGTCWVSTGKSLRAPGDITGTTVFCAGVSGTFSISAILGATSYTWSVPSGANITSGRGTTSINVTFGDYSGNICVNANNSCETSLNTCIPITVNAAPATPGNITGPTTVARSSPPVSYSVGAISGASTYNWTVPAGAIITSGAGTTNIVVNYPCSSSSGNISVTAQSACGTSAASTLTIIAGPIANVLPNGNISTLPVTLGGTIGIPTGSLGTAPYTYAWSPTTGLSSTTVANPVVYNYGTSNTYTVTVTDANGCSATSSNNFTPSSPVTFNNTSTGQSGTIYSWAVPTSITSIAIEAWGAQGGTYGSNSGGLGANVKGTFSVTSGQLLKILVGQQGVSLGGYTGGGGGTFITTSANSPLIIAGGGGGADTPNGINGQAGVSANGGTNSSCCAGGTGGAGGNATNAAAGGGGLTGNGVNSSCSGTNGGLSFINGGTGGQGSNSNGGAGGYGGGGGGDGNCQGGGGGGGGYSGGGGGTNTGAGAGGGGSYNNGTSQSNTSGVQTGNGKVVITY